MEYFTTDFLRFSSTNVKICRPRFAIKSKHFGDFLEISHFLKIVTIVVRQLMKQLVHWFSRNKNLLPFCMWWRKIMLKRPKVYKSFLQDWPTSKFLNLDTTVKVWHWSLINLTPISLALPDRFHLLLIFFIKIIDFLRYITEMNFLTR